VILPIGYSDETPNMPRRQRPYDVVGINSYDAKVVNLDMFFDDYSEAMRKKIFEAKEALTEKGPLIGKKIAEKGKEKIKGLQEMLKDRMEARRKKKEKALEKELGGEEEVLEDTEEPQ
jgi:hypothetical protein